MFHLIQTAVLDADCMIQQLRIPTLKNLVANVTVGKKKVQSQYLFEKIKHIKIQLNWPILSSEHQIVCR